MTKVNLGKDTSGRPLVLDDTTLAKVRWAEAQLGWTFALIQGSYRASDPLNRSGGTHDAGGAVDLRTWDIPKSLPMTKVLTVLRQAGLIAWYRPQAAFPDHEIHALDYGNPNLSPAAKAQVTAWQHGRNGLSGSLEGPDDGPKVAIPKEVPSMAARIDGIDLSHYQGGSLDFDAAKKAGVRWVYHKVSEGSGGLDANYATRRAQVAKAGLRFGGYHFARPGSTSGVAQARLFLAHATPKPGDMRPMLDLEDNGGLGHLADHEIRALHAKGPEHVARSMKMSAAKSPASLTAWVKSFVTEVIAQTGAPPMIYTHFDLDDTFDCPLWVARYSDAMSAPHVPAPWKQYTIWQFSDGVYGHPNTVPGIGACDINTMNGDPAALTDVFALGGTPDPKKPTPPPEDWFDMATQKDLQDAIAAAIPDIAKAVANMPVANKDAHGNPVNTGTLAGMVSRIDIVEDQVTNLLNALGPKVDEILAAANAGKSSGGQ